MKVKPTLIAILLASCGAAGADALAFPAGRGAAEAARGGAGSMKEIAGLLRLDSENGAIAPRGLQEAIGLAVPDVPHFPRCLTPLVTEISMQSEASRHLRTAMAPLMATPRLASESVHRSDGGHWEVHYTLDRASGDSIVSSDRNRNGLPDYVDRVSSALDASRHQFVTRLGFRDPAQEAPLPVYLANLGGRIDGYAVSPGPGFAGFIVVDSRLLGNDALLRAAVAHQYAHATANTYEVDAPAWWAEATATWLEGHVVGSWAHHDDSARMAAAQASLGLEHDDVRSLPGRFLWPAYLAASTDLPIVRAIWEGLDLEGPGGDLWEVTELALRSTGSTLDQAFDQYALWLLVWGGGGDPTASPFAVRLGPVPFASEHGAYPVVEIQTAPPVAPMGAAYHRFSADSSEGGLRISFEGDVPGLFQAQVLLRPRREGVPLVRASVSIDARGRGEIGVPWSTYSEAVLIVGNVMLEGERASYSYVARPDADFPFTLDFFSLEPDEGEVRVLWETDSEDGLFGWVLYRSELSGGPSHRVNDIVVPAIGDGDGPVAYQYLDAGVAKGRTYYYRLVGVTYDGLTKEVPEARVDLRP